MTRMKDTIREMMTKIRASTGRFKTKCQDRLPNNWLEQYIRELEDEEQALPKIKWIRDHRRETRRGNQILQREMHLSALVSYHETMTEEQIARNPAHANELRGWETELKQLNRDYWMHRDKLTEIEKSKPRGNMVEDYYRIQHRRPHVLWRLERIFCQLRGGCCARDCGCCERTWRTIRDPHGLPGYLHCSRGCGCCQRNGGSD